VYKVSQAFVSKIIIEYFTENLKTLHRRALKQTFVKTLEKEE